MIREKFQNEKADHISSKSVLNAGIRALVFISGRERGELRRRYFEYSFQIVDAQGNAHEVKCEWDVDAAYHMATPRNEQARYYWAKARPGWNR